jgi:hypothetical protein
MGKKQDGYDYKDCPVCGHYGVMRKPSDLGENHWECWGAECLKADMPVGVDLPFIAYPIIPDTVSCTQGAS